MLLDCFSPILTGTNSKTTHNLLSYFLGSIPGKEAQKLPLWTLNTLAKRYQTTFLTSKKVRRPALWRSCIREFNHKYRHFTLILWTVYRCHDLKRICNKRKLSYLYSFRASRIVVYFGTYLQVRIFHRVGESHRVHMEALSSEAQHHLETNLPPFYKVCGLLSSRSGCVVEQWSTSKATAKVAPFCRVSC